MIFWSTIAGPVFNPENSMVADKTATTPVPVRSTASRRAPSRAAGASAFRRTSIRRKKDAAWLALTWITNKAVEPLLRSRSTRSTPTARSAFADPELVAKFPYLHGSR